MIIFEQAKEELKSFYIGNGFRLFDEHAKELFFAAGVDDQTRFKIPESEIEDYRSIAEEPASFQITPVATSLVGPQYREQLVDLVGPSRTFLGFLRRQIIQFKTIDGSGSELIEIGPPSSKYLAIFRCKKELASFFHTRLSRFPRLEYDNIPTMRDVFDRFLTIKMHATSGLTNELMDETTSLFQTALFDLSYLRNIHLHLVQDWPSLANRRRTFRVDRVSIQDGMYLKRVKYDDPAVRFYHRGVSAEDAYIQFISFYHVLEYHFVSVSDRILYNRLSRIFIDPAFRPAAAHFDKIITAVEDHKRTNDETEMLKNVLTQYTDERDIIEFIEKYEKKENAKIYSDKNQAFGEDLEKIQLKEGGHIFTPLAKRIKTIRNTLVHSSDRYERKQRYLPGPEADKVLVQEVPLMKFIAERVIIATARKL
jgi:hypothetical protein